MAHTVAQINPNAGEATYALPANTRQFRFWVSTLATDCTYRASSTGTPEVDLAVNIVYGPFSAKDMNGETLYFNSAGNTTVDILVETGFTNS